ncbi:aspartic peptidase domain-containing protein [Lophiotrema nucula]|uniref:Aspartic peptidase domain-containing protein n=1 Tax=Lophiotrema nucula TaxID=690887 RepID=A0A6A5Z884_9PLEO|nr:aspartic peptidase domain-containing protein [Lophiotrema nucula]
MVSDRLIPPVFSLALGRSNSDESYIAFGGLPPVKVDGNFTSTPLIPAPGSSSTEFTTYRLDVDAFTYGGYPNASAVKPGQFGGNALTDSGTITINVPNDIADAYNKLFDPPAIFPAEVGFWIIDCKAHGPKEPFYVVINSTTFTFPGSDFVLGDVLLSDNGIGGKYGNYCFSGIQEGGIWNSTGHFTLGRPFMQNVVAVHDVGAQEMRFAQRKY